jgi:hypothetical protein
VITHDKIGADEDLAREVLIVGLDIAPCLSGLADDSEEQLNALAVLRRVYKEIAGRGARFVKSQSSGSSSVTYTDVQSAFAGQPTRALRALCGAAQAPGGHSVGSFPTERPVSRIWPETY